MRGQLNDPRAISHYVRVYNEERMRLASEAKVMRAKLELRLQENARGWKRFLDRVCDGSLADPQEVALKNNELAAEKAEINAALADLPETPKIVTLHPKVLDHYARDIDDLSRSLSQAIASGSENLRISMRKLVATVTVVPDQTGTAFTVEVAGKLAALIGGDPFPNASHGYSVVAEEGIEPPTHGL